MSATPARHTVTREEASALLARPPGKHKYKAKPVTLDGIRFDSTAEANRFALLKQLERVGHISELRLQPHYELHAPSGEVIGRYVADFEYVENGETVTEDVKGVSTDLFKWKRRHFEAEYSRKIWISK